MKIERKTRDLSTFRYSLMQGQINISITTLAIHFLLATTQHLISHNSLNLSIKKFDFEPTQTHPSLNFHSHIFFTSIKFLLFLIRFLYINYFTVN